MGVPSLKFAHGTCDGTGAVINVCLGWKPVYVKIWNHDDGGSLYAEVEWTREMSLVTAMDEGIMHEGGDDSDRQMITTGGISTYDGGDEITYDTTSAAWENSSGTSKEEVYVNGYYQRAASTSAAYQCIGDVLCPEKTDGAKVKTPAGFKIGTNGDLNVDGEQLSWIAFGN